MADFITIYTDASLCQATKVGGWACWIKYGDGQTMRGSDVFKSRVNCATMAELWAIANALKIVGKQLRPEKAIIVVVTDSLGAIESVNGNGWQKHTKKHAQVRELGKMIRDLVPESCTLRVKKVKAHTGNSDPRSYVNNLVDQDAKRCMRAAREELSA